MRTTKLFVAKNFGFLKSMICPNGQGGSEEVEPVRIFFRQGGRESIICDFLRASFIMDFYHLS